MAEEDRMCEVCGNRRATVHLTDFVEGRPVQHDLCRECFESKEGVSLPPASVLAQLLSAVAPEVREMGTRQCPECGINYLEFRQSLKLGCPADYAVFDKAMGQFIERVQGATSHCGKVRATRDRRSGRRIRVRSLRERQRQAIAEENYELAARLRDRIRELTQDESEKPE